MRGIIDASNVSGIEPHGKCESDTVRAGTKLPAFVRLLSPIRHQKQAPSLSPGFTGVSRTFCLRRNAPRCSVVRISEGTIRMMLPGQLSFLAPEPVAPAVKMA